VRDEIGKAERRKRPPRRGLFVIFAAGNKQERLNRSAAVSYTALPYKTAFPPLRGRRSGFFKKTEKIAKKY
jgi:hypothetical protein